MTNKEKLKIAMEQDINTTNNYNEIIKKIEKGTKMKNKNNILKWSLVPICLVTIITGFIVINNDTFTLSPEHPSSDKPYVDSENNTVLNINKVDKAGVYSLDLDIDIIQDSNYSMIPYFEELSNLNVPSDFDNTQYFKIYGKSCDFSKEKDCTNASYDKLINYQFLYKNAKNDRNIVISFSEDNKPARDYYFEKEGSKKSSINGVDLVIYQYEEIYFTEFVYKNINFDVETSNITEQELSTLLFSIIE